MSEVDVTNFDDLPEEESVETAEEQNNSEEEAEEQEEQVKDESPDGDSTVENDEQEGGEEQFYENETEYLKEMGVGGDNLDEALKSYASEKQDYQTNKSQIEQIEAVLKARGFEGGIKSLIAGESFKEAPPTTIKPQEHETSGKVFTSTPFSDVFEEMGGQDLDDTSKKFYRTFNKMADKALGSQFGKLEGMLSSIVENVIANQSSIEGMRWDTLQHPGKKHITKAQFDSVRKTYNIDDPDKIMNLLAIADPTILESITKSAEKKGERRGKKFSKKFKGGMGRGKGSEKGKSGVNWKKYYTPVGNGQYVPDERKLGTLDPASQLKILNAAERDTKPN